MRRSLAVLLPLALLLACGDATPPPATPTTPAEPVHPTPAPPAVAPSASAAQPLPTPPVTTAPAVASAPRPVAPSSPVAVASAMISSLRAGDYEQATVAFDAKMQQSLGPSGLRGSWASIQAQAGQLTGMGKPSTETVQGMTVVHFPARFESMDADVQVVVDPQTMQVRGFWVRPPRAY